MRSSLVTAIIVIIVIVVILFLLFPRRTRQNTRSLVTTFTPALNSGIPAVVGIQTSVTQTQEGNIAQLTWTPVAGATEYDVLVSPRRVSSASAVPADSRSRVQGNAAEIVLPGGQQWFLYVVAVGNGSTSPLSQPTIITL